MGFVLVSKAKFRRLIQHIGVVDLCTPPLLSYFSCPKGGFISLRNNDLRDFTAKVLDECHTNENFELVLTPLIGENFTHATTFTRSLKSTWHQTFLPHTEEINWEKRKCIEEEFQWSTRCHWYFHVWVEWKKKVWFSINDSLILWLTKEETRNTLQQQIG